MKSSISSRQLMALTFVSMISPFLRLLPASVTAQAGSAAWVSSALSLFPAMLLNLMIGHLVRSFPQMTGFPTMISRIFGKFAGNIVTFLWSVWLVFHSGFLLRSGADRFIATIYPNTKPIIFIAVTVVLCTVAALGQIKPLARCAEIFRPLLLLVIIPVILFSIEDVEPTFLLPVTAQHIPGILKGLPLAAEAVSVVLVNTLFLSKYLQPEAKRRSLTAWIIGVTILNTVFCAVSVGSLGKTYTSALTYPFFIMARDLSLLSGVERIEALVVGLWLLPDFVLITVELVIASDNLMQIFGQTEQLISRRIFILGAAAFAALVAFRIAPNSETMHQWSDRIIPMIHLLWAYGMIPLLLITARLRRKF